MSLFLAFVRAFIAAQFLDRVEYVTHHYVNCERDLRVTVAWHGGIRSVEFLRQRDGSALSRGR